MEKMLRNINSSTSYNLYMTEKIDGKENLVYQFKSNKIHYYVYTQINNITNNEKELLEFLISQKFSNYYKTTHRNDAINRILKEDLNKIEIQEYLNSLNIDIKSSFISITLKIYNVDRIEDVFEILLNLEEIKYITKTEENIITIFTEKELNQAIDFAKLIVELIEVEILEKVKIGISSSKKAVEMKTTYQQSVESINIAEGFKLPHNIHRYDELLIYRILSKISVDDMNDIVAEVYNYGIKSLDEEDIRTGIVFLSCDLNISEAARNLYIHRNTLIYRLDKIQKNTSLDLRNFEDALKFRVLLILNNYLVFNK
ncbi:helix-turn-helix domain-containing protein [Clostridium sp. D2Q-11]|uniref:Helix-turn-helix domain-containing protein n=1 Tax=Anaeromonas frigoriresistens TaxID=2683708 RepID=A0A942UZP9_9FIRM|nr:PucR family transcriptional regulator [Anaeromonas frigoriresistens]MBS4537422.1 helix-turn-helix domain-containing protein [Anaeromonas frigoriresistens]